MAPSSPYHFMKGVGFGCGGQVTYPRTAEEFAGFSLWDLRCWETRSSAGTISLSEKSISSERASLIPTFLAAAGPRFGCQMWRTGNVQFLPASLITIFV